MNIEFLSTVAVIAPDPAASRELYVSALGLRSARVDPKSERRATCVRPQRLGTHQRRPKRPANRHVPRGDVTPSIPAIHHIQRESCDLQDCQALSRTRTVDPLLTMELFGASRAYTRDHSRHSFSCKST